MKMQVLVSVVTLGLAAICAKAAPMSDGIYFYENFAGNQAGAATMLYTENGGTYTLADNAANLVTINSYDVALVRAYDLGLAASTNFVLEFDYRVNAATGDRFSILNSQSYDAPYQTGISIEIAEGVDSTWQFTVLDNTGSSAAYTGYSYGAYYHFAIEYTGNANADVLVYINGVQAGTFQGQNASLGTDLIQFGDFYSGYGYGDVSVTNISIGNVVPEPASMTLLASAAGLLLMRRR